MKYITRTLERKFLHMESFFKVVLVTGARQVGKSTMLKHLADKNNRNYVSLDVALDRELAQTDPALFFQTYTPPVLIDEIQRAPQLFPQIKIMCDENEDTGQFWLTGSQQYNMMQNVRESLAGRVGILNLYSMSQSEIEGISYDDELDFSQTVLRERESRVEKNNVRHVFEHIWRGGMPQVLDADEEQRQEYYNSYVDTYIMRDVSEAANITDSLRFRKFLIACAALTSELVNYKRLAEIAQVSQPTAKEWLRVLEGLGIIYLLQPYSNNELKRLTKVPKLYFCDTGLCAFLSMWHTPDTLRTGAASGKYFENYVVSELLRNYAYARSTAGLSYLRDSNKKEIDVCVEKNNLIHPLEIKQSATPDRREVKKYEILDKASIERSHGGIICMCEKTVPIDDMNCFIPCNII